MTDDSPSNDPAQRLSSAGQDEAAPTTNEQPDPVEVAAPSEAAEPQAEPQAFSAADEANAIQAEPTTPFNREAIAARAFQVYSDHVTATARSMHETPTEELHRRHDQAAKARHGLSTGHKVR